MESPTSSLSGNWRTLTGLILPTARVCAPHSPQLVSSWSRLRATDPRFEIVSRMTFAFRVPHRCSYVLPDTTPTIVLFECYGTKPGQTGRSNAFNGSER